MKYTLEYFDNGTVNLTEQQPKHYLLTVCANGFGKVTDPCEHRQQTRGSKGMAAIKVNAKTGKVVGALMVPEDGDVILMTSTGKIIRTPVAGIRITGRNASGVKLVNIPVGEKVVKVALVQEYE